jgi:hypothetical protein
VQFSQPGDLTYMKLKYALIAGALACGFAIAPIQAQDQPIKDDVKDAGKATGRAAKKTGKKVKKGSKKAVNKSAEATEKGAAKVKDKSQ